MAAHAAGAPTPRCHVVKSNGVGLAAYEWPGGGPAVVAIHGLTSNHTAWYPIADVLAGRHRLIAHDLRGRGNSEKPDKGYSLAEHSADLLGLLDHFGLERAIVMGHSLGAHIGVHFASHHGDRVTKLVLVDGGLDVRAEVFDSIAPSVNRLGVEFPSVEMFLAIVQTLPMFAGRWNDHLARHFTYDVEPGPGGGVRSKVARHSIEEEVTNLQRTRLWAWHRRIAAPTLLLRAQEAEAMAHAIPDCRLVVVPGTNHYTILLGDHPLVRRELAAFLAP